MFVVHDAHRYPSLAKAPNNSQPLVVTADHDCPDSTPSKCKWSGFGTGFIKHCSLGQPFPLLRVIEYTNSFAANSVPDTKPSTGPKLQAAGLPAKCNPGTEHSKPRLSTG